MQKFLLNFIELAYTPLSNYDFAIAKMDTIIPEFLNRGKIYAIVQRPVLTIHNFTIKEEQKHNPIAEFEIHQKGNNEILIATMPLYQNMFGASQDAKLDIAFTYAYPKPEILEHKLPKSGLANFIIKTQGGKVIWLSPEKFLYHYIRKAFECSVIGDIAAFLRYDIHYVGKATEQDVVKRLTGHSHLQEILSIEHPLKHGSLPTDEIAILLFKFKDNIHISNCSHKDDIDETANLLYQSMEGIPPIEQRKIYLDAEKALINVLKPKHNRQLYKNYPKSKDGISSLDYSSYSYCFTDPITLVYNNEEFRGPSTDYLGDKILIKDGKIIVIKDM